MKLEGCGAMSFFYNLDPRCLDILNHLLYTDGYLTIQELSNEKNISKRSVYYDFCKINEYLNEHNIPSIEVERNKGIFISQEMSEEIKNLLSSVPNDTPYVFSPMERVKIIICSVMKKTEALYIEDFMSLCQVSRNTIINDLKVVQGKLVESNLALAYENKKGYRIHGDIVRKRTIFFLHFSSLASFYRKGIIPLDNIDRVNEIEDKLNEIEELLDTQYGSGTLFAISVFFASIEERSDRVTFSDMDKGEISSTKEYQLVEKYFPDFKESESYYLALHLLGSRLQTIPLDLMKKDENEEAYELAKSLVSEFSRLSCVEFEKVEEIEEALYAHLKTSLYRYRYGIQLGNPMLNDIKNEYSELFEITKKACEYLEQQLEVPIPDGEIAYITLHFGGFMNATQSEEKELRVLIICPNGVSTGNMLRAEVHALVPHAKDVDVISLSSFDNNKKYDVVISTIAIEGEKDITVVHPILTDNDRVIILRKCMKNDNKHKIEIEHILNIAKKYVKEDKIEYLKEDLVKYFTSSNVSTYTAIKDFGSSICKYLSASHINIIEEQVSWQESIRMSSKVLLEEGYIEQLYIDSMIQKNIELGPCMFITDGVVLAHAKVEEGSRQLGVSMNIFKKEVVYEKGKTANIVLVLAAEDQVKHFKILNDIMVIFSDRKNIKDIFECKNEEEVEKLIQSILEREEIKNGNE